MVDEIELQFPLFQKKREEEEEKEKKEKMREITS